MAKKKAPGIRCQSCNQKLRGSWGGCPRCGRPRLARDGMGKTIGTTAFLARGAGVRCGNCGAASRPGASYCTSCGKVALSVVKSDFDSRRDDLIQKIHREHDPQFREGWWGQLNKLYGTGES